MATSNGPPFVVERAAPIRLPVRIRMAATSTRNHLDGAWWPRSRDGAVELAHLVDHLAPSSGRIIRALVCAGDWNATLRRIPVRDGHLKVGFFPRDDTHLIVLTTAERIMLCVLVVPPEFTQAQGREALLPSAIARRARSTSELLHEAVAHADTNPLNCWLDDGGSWWPGPAMLP
jgi:hypothetical protein